MSRRPWLFAGMILTAPFLLFTGLLALTALHALLFTVARPDWWVENRTAAPLWVTPLGVGDRGPVRLPHYASWLALYSGPPLGEVLIPPGERRRLVVDGNVAADVGGPPGLVVKTVAGGHRYCTGTADAEAVRFVLEERVLRSPATEAMIAAVRRPARPILFGVPFGLIVFLGLTAPAVLLGLRRAYRRRSERR